MTIIRIKNISIEVVLIWLAVGIALVGFTTTIIGAFLNGLAMFNGSRDLSEGFGLILIGNSISLLGVVIIVLVFLLSIFRQYRKDTNNVGMNTIDVGMNG